MDAPRSLSSYRIDARPSRFTVQVTAAGLLSAFGHNPVIAIRNFSGEARFQPDTLESTSLRVVVQAASLEVSGDVSDKDRREIERSMQDRVLESTAYPEIVFQSSSVKVSPAGPGQYRVEIVGQLSLHGVTREHIVSARVTVGPDRLRASGDFSLQQTDYGIELVSVAGGALKVKDELKCSFDILASSVRAQDSAAA
ncbi:MAG TPA: YceI family protein [Terriglobales bacterium]|jgi:polyisoprenoid-binding protein YceI|nr:YceI family protein [Terriglobales bacterium]